MNEETKDPGTHNAIATVDAASLPTADLDPGQSFFGGPSTIWTSLPQNTDEERALVLKAATSAPDLKPADLMMTPFPMANILAHSVTLFNDKTGEYLNAVRCVLIDPGGKTASFVSEGIQKNLGMVFQLFGKPPFSPALFVRVKQVDTRRGNRTYNLEVLGRQVAESAAGRK